MMLQLSPPLPLETPKGKGWAHFVIDLGPEADLQWVVFLDKEFREDQPGGVFTVYHAGTCWTFQNREIKMQENLTLGRKRTLSFDDAPAGASLAGYCSTHGVFTGWHPCSWCEDERKAKPSPLVEEKPWTLICQHHGEQKIFPTPGRALECPACAGGNTPSLFCAVHGFVSTRKSELGPLECIVCWNKKQAAKQKPAPDAMKQAPGTAPWAPSFCEGLPETRPPAEHADHDMHWLCGELGGQPVPAQWIKAFWYSPGYPEPISPSEMHRRGRRYYAPAYAPGWDYGEKGNGGLREGGLYHLVRMGQQGPKGEKFVVVDAGDYERWCIERKPA